MAVSVDDYYAKMLDDMRAYVDRIVNRTRELDEQLRMLTREATLVRAKLDRVARDALSAWYMLRTMQERARRAAGGGADEEHEHERRTSDDQQQTRGTVGA